MKEFYLITLLKFNLYLNNEIGFFSRTIIIKPNNYTAANFKSKGAKWENLLKINYKF